MSVIDLNAARKWGKIPKDIQQRILENAYCSKCSVTTITDYSLYDDEQGVLLKGTCKKCGGEVTRVVEDI